MLKSVILHHCHFQCSLVITATVGFLIAEVSPWLINQKHRLIAAQPASSLEDNPRMSLILLLSEQQMKVGARAMIFLEMRGLNVCLFLVMIEKQMDSTPRHPWYSQQ